MRWNQCWRRFGTVAIWMVYLLRNGLSGTNFVVLITSPNPCRTKTSPIIRLPIQHGKSVSHGSHAKDFLSCIMAEAEVFLMYDPLLPMCIEGKFCIWVVESGQLSLDDRVLRKGLIYFLVCILKQVMKFSFSQFCYWIEVLITGRESNWCFLDFFQC